MKLVCSQTELNTALQLVSRAVASRPTHPVLANVLLTADAGTDRLSLTGFDLSLGIQTSLPASVDTSGAVTLPARLFGEIVSRLSSDSPITLTTDDSGEQVELTSLSGNYQMRGMPADDFPDLPLVENGTAVKLDPAALVRALRSTLFASSADEAKQLLTGVHLRFDQTRLEAASTDGHRLAVLSVDDALGEAPDWLCIPMGNAGNITAYWMGFQEYNQAGRSRKLPRMMGFQASGSAPLVNNNTVTDPDTIATAIRIGNPVNREKAIAARKASQGDFLDVTDAEIIEAYKLLGGQEGVFCEPASAASVAGLLKRKDEVPTGATVVCVLTGNGLKDPDCAINNNDAAFHTDLDPDLGTVARVMGF